MTARLDISLFSALCLLLAVTFCSCSQIYDDEGPCEQEQKKGNGISLKFKIYTEPSSQTSRALGQWEEASANVSERILNPDDVRVLLLNNAAEPQLVKTFKPNRLDYVKGQNEGGTITGDGYYELSVYFEDESIDRMDDDAQFTFNVMIFANINSLGGGYVTDNMGIGTRRSNLQELFTMPYNWFPSNTQGIPMYGCNKELITVTKKQLEDENYVMGEITMLRALCKIEVYDKIIGAVTVGDKKYPSVEKVELITWRDKGYLRPLYDGYESGLTQAHIPKSTVNNNVYLEHKGYLEEEGYQGDLPDLTVNAPEREDGVDIDEDGSIDPCFRIYCPEAKLADLAIRVTAKLGPKDEESKNYDVWLGQYADGGPDNDAPDRIFGNDLVRNHIYRFKVNSLSAMADLTVKVSEWGKEEAEHTLDDIISMEADGYLKWTWDPKNNDNFSDTDETYNGKELKQLNILNGTTDYATGTFKINSPKGATWRAFFIPGENGVDAFEFVDVDAAGNVIEPAHSFVEGVIGDTEATIRVRGKGPADVYRHTAELVIEVHQADGTVLYAPLTSDGKTSYVIYRENKL